MAEIIKNFIHIIKSFIATLDPDLVTGIKGSLIASLIFLLIAFFFKELKRFFNSLFAHIFNLLRTRKSKIESIQIEGATIINKPFVARTVSFGKKQKFQAEDFYLAKQYEYCQWYGILKKWDIERGAYKKIIEEIKDSFTDEYRQPKIIALIHGRGGSGKSTLMRRLAIDCVTEDFCVLWINDKEITKFYENGISQLNKYSEIKFLVFIEDWYRIKQNTENANEIINSICYYSNVRVIIGDRTIDSSVSKEHIFNPDENIIELSVRENKNTIDKIIEKVPQWKLTAEMLLTKDNDYNSTLYLILWVIARTYKVKNKFTSENKIKSEGIIGHFQTIVESDLKAIAKHYSGLAKMLYYWGSIYSEKKKYIGFEVFIKLANFFSIEAYDSKYAFASNEIKPILDIYINKTIGLVKSAGQLPLIAFNHDILTDEGLSKAQISGWYKFDDSIKLQMLPIIINNGDDYSSSNYFNYTLSTINKEKFSNNERLGYLKTLFEKGNRENYLKWIFDKTLEINETEKTKFAIEILNDFIKYEYAIDLICNCLNQVKSTSAGHNAASYILSQKEFWKLPHQIVSIAMKTSKNENEKEDAALKILSQKEFWKLLPYQIVTTAMQILKNEKELEKAANNILMQEEFWKIYDSIVVIAMKISKNENEKEDAALKILSQKEFWKLPFEMVTSAMKILKNEEIKIKVASDILSQPNFFYLNHSIVVTAMKISKNVEEKENAALEIISQKDFFKLPKEIVVTSMKILKNDTVRKKAATDILSQPDFFILDKDIVSLALKISKDNNKAIYFLEKWEKSDWYIVFQSLHCFSGITIRPQIVLDIIETIINSYSKGSLHFFRYSQLLKIPFFGVPIWEFECDRIINNYKRISTSLINSVLISHRSHPDKIKYLCTTILRLWRNEIITQIRQLNGEKHYGDNIKIALGHPDLKIIAKRTAQEIQTYESAKPGSIPMYLLEIVHYIIIDKKYPEWILQSDN